MWGKGDTAKTTTLLAVYTKAHASTSNMNKAEPITSNHSVPTAPKRRASQALPTSSSCSHGTACNTRRRVVRDTSPHQHQPATAPFGEGPSSVGIQDSLPAYDDIGDCDQRCHHCGAAFWYKERLKGHSKSARPEYHSCCGGGKIFMHPEPDPPDYINTLLQDKHFIELLVMVLISKFSWFYIYS